MRTRHFRTCNPLNGIPHPGTFLIDKAYPMLKTFAEIHYDALKGHLNVSKDYTCKLYKQTCDYVSELCLSAFDQEQ